MAHQLSPDEVDALAADQAATIEPAKEDHLSAPLGAEAILAYGAEGEPVTKLVNVLAVLGHSTNSVIHGGPARLDETVLVDVRTAQAELGISEPDPLTVILSPEEGSASVEIVGELVGARTLKALYEAAAAKLESEQAADAPAGS